VVPAVKQTSLAEEASKETVHWHYAQQPEAFGEFTLRTTLPPEQLTGAAAAALATIDPDVPLQDVLSMDSRILRSLGPQRAPMVLTLAFAAGAFTLAVVGIYGLLNWAVTQRYGEIGVRVAFGAKTTDVVRMVLGQGVRLIAIGLVFGIACAAALGRLMSSQIYDVSAADPVVFASAAVALTLAAVLASWLPARRAARIDPMQALREE
jgi:putative ABC transport system permease protein